MEFDDLDDRLYFWLGTRPDVASLLEMVAIIEQMPCDTRMPVSAAFYGPSSMLSQPVDQIPAVDNCHHDTFHDN